MRKDWISCGPQPCWFPHCSLTSASCVLFSNAMFFACDWWEMRNVLESMSTRNSFGGGVGQAILGVYQSLPLALCSGIFPGGVRGTVCYIYLDWTMVGYVWGKCPTRCTMAPAPISLLFYDLLSGDPVVLGKGIYLLCDGSSLRAWHLAISPQTAWGQWSFCKGQILETGLSDQCCPGFFTWMRDLGDHTVAVIWWTLGVRSLDYPLKVQVLYIGRCYGQGHRNWF